MVTLHEVITFLVSMQISISSLQTHNVNRCGRSSQLARKLSLRRKRSSPNVFEMAATETITSIILIKLIRVSLGTVSHTRCFKIVVIDIQIFFFQAEDGIRDADVTGVQTCDLPICSDSIYAETIYTSRSELVGNYQLPLKEKLMLMFSANGHDQNSRYGDEIFDAVQNIGFGQFVWDKTINRHQLLMGTSLRYTFYDDNTVATEKEIDGEVTNQPSETYLPGIFVQNEWKFAPQHVVLAGIRYDYNSLHGSIVTPRINYKWTSRNKMNIFRLSGGSGYRVANVFTEDHAALTGAREVVFLSELKPETSWNGNVNYVRKFHFNNGLFLNFDASVFYTYF